MIFLILSGGYVIHYAGFECRQCNHLLTAQEALMTRLTFPASFERAETVFTWSLLEMLLEFSHHQSRFAFSATAKVLSLLNEPIACDKDALIFTLQASILKQT